MGVFPCIHTYWVIKEKDPCSLCKMGKTEIIVQPESDGNLDPRFPCGGPSCSVMATKKCSRQCMAACWPEHKKVCMRVEDGYTVAPLEGRGMGCLAKRDFEPGEVILQD